jgi:hypothetical protein
MGLLQPDAGYDGCFDGGEIARDTRADMPNPFTAHPASVGETYAQHFRFALGFGVRMTFGGLAAVVHAVLPFLFVTTASGVLEKLNAMRDPNARRTDLG